MEFCLFRICIEYAINVLINVIYLNCSNVIYVDCNIFFAARGMDGIKVMKVILSGSLHIMVAR